MLSVDDELDDELTSGSFVIDTSGFEEPMGGDDLRDMGDDVMVDSKETHLNEEMINLTKKKLFGAPAVPPEDEKRIMCMGDDALMFSEDLSAFRESELWKGTKGVWWLDVEDPTVAEIKMLQSLLHLHPVTSEDCIDPSVREKWELFNERQCAYLFVAIHELNYNRDRDPFSDVIKVCVVLFSGGIATFHKEPIKSRRGVLYRIQKNHDGVIPSASWVYYALTDGVVDLFQSSLEAVVSEISIVDELVLTLNHGDQMDLLRRIRNVRLKLTFLRNYISPKQDVLVALTSRQVPFVQSSVTAYLRDVLDHVIRMNGMLETGRETLNSSHSNYLASISIRVAQESNKTNDAMKKLSAAATIFLPLTLIAGLFGMNVAVPGAADKTLWWFWMIVAVCVLITLFGVVYLRRRGLL